ncbi:MAG: hypothetical protein H7A46_18455 [Verrucomicrobiales bacterium]|nr:hypothetical protein [Verrucomicrobiales bacterium]
MTTEPLVQRRGAVALGGMLLLSGQLLAQPCVLWPDGCFVLTEHSCLAETNWVEAVDLDGDEVPDLWRRRMNVEMRCSLEGEWVLQRDQIEAFYPEPHVEVWVEYASPFHIAFGVAPGALIGDPVLLECAVPMWLCRAWSSDYPPAQPYLEAEGLGILHRVTDCYPNSCFSAVSIGVLGTATLGPGDVREVLVGLRLRQEEAWHLGWARLQFRQPWPELRPPYTEMGGVSLVDHAIHPIPETPIVAGEPPRPTLEARIEKDEVILSWHAAWTGYVLERSPAVTGGAWEPVPGVENNSVRVSKAGPPAFFRLKQE